MNTIKRYLISLICILALLITSCATQISIDQPKVTEPETGADVTDDPDETRREVNANDEYIPTMNTYKEYTEYIRAVKLPQTFVPYEALSDFGVFDSFVYRGTESSYLYSIRDTACDRLICLTIYPRPMKEEFAVSRAEQEDMLHFACKGWGYLQIENVYYHYYDGTLRKISIDMGDYYYTISAQDELYTLPSGKESAISRLLTRSTVKDTNDKLIASIESARKELKLD
jgi:hypothetical protein